MDWYKKGCCVSGLAELWWRESRAETAGVRLGRRGNISMGSLGLDNGIPQVRTKEVVEAHCLTHATQEWIRPPMLQCQKHSCPGWAHRKDQLVYFFSL